MRFERRKHHHKDWLAIAIIFSAAFIVANFVLQDIERFEEDVRMQAYFDSFRFDALQYKWNIITSDSTPEKTYEAFRQALLDNDLDIVLKLIHPDYLWEYEDGFREGYEAGEFSSLAQEFTPIKQVERQGNFIRYQYKNLPAKSPGEVFEPYPYVEFTRDTDGIWKISSM